MTIKFFKIIYIATCILISINLAKAGIDDKAKDSSISSTNPLELNENNIKAGKKLWRKIGCYSCHGGNAEGGVGPSLQDDTWVYKPTDAMLFQTISKGRRGTNMVGWEKDLTTEEIWKIIIYIRSIYNGDPNKIIW